MTKLRKCEKETIILFNQSDTNARIQTYNPKLTKRLLAFHKRFPESCRIEHELQQGGMIFDMDKERLYITLMPPYSKARKSESSKRMRKHNSKKK